LLIGIVIPEYIQFLQLTHLLPDLLVLDVDALLEDAVFTSEVLRHLLGDLISVRCEHEHQEPLDVFRRFYLHELFHCGLTISLLKSLLWRL
jgi:hypothetical protein